MSLKTQNNRGWQRDRLRHHPPSCSCYLCNDDKGSQQAERQRADGDFTRSTEAVRQTVDSRGDVRVSERPVSPRSAPTRRRRPREGGLFRAFWLVTFMAVLYAFGLHALVLLGLVTYTISQEGFLGIIPMLSDAGDAYLGSWGVGNPGG